MSRDLLLITGGSGWLGQRLLEVLARGGLCAVLPPGAEGLPEGHLPSCERASDSSSRQPRVRCLVQAADDASRVRARLEEAEVVVGDLRAPDSLEPFFLDAEQAALVHCAGVIHPEHSLAELTSVNVGGTEALLTLARRSGVRRFVYLSSSACAGPGRDRYDILTEESLCRPYMAYGRSKLRAEQAVWRASAQGLETVILRPPWFYGPWQPPRQSRFFRMVRRGLVPFVGDGMSPRSLVYIDHLVQAILLALETDAAVGETFWIADGRPTCLREIVDVISRVIHEETRIKCLPPMIKLPQRTDSVAEMLDALSQRMGCYSPALHVFSELGKTIACETLKAQRMLGYRPWVGLDAGMRLALRWMLQQGESL